MAEYGDKSWVYEHDKKHVWHAFAPHSENDPWVVESGVGAYVTDLEGNRYLDAMAGLWSVNVGYGRERLAKAAYEQMAKLPFYPLTAAHVPATKLAHKLSDWLQGEFRVFFNNSGSEANETAFKMARQYHHQNGSPTRFKIISRYRAYHGSTMGALSATGQQQRKFLYEPLAPGFLHIQPPDVYRRPSGVTAYEFEMNAAKQLEQTILWEGPETVAAFIMEPFITGGGVLIHSPLYIEEVSRICKQYGVLLIVDEVICGFGRTGKNFGFQHSDVVPDIVTMAKGISSSYVPLSATAMRAELYEKFTDTSDPYHYFRQVNTFGGHPVACAVALENLAIMEEENLVQNSERVGEYLKQELSGLLDSPYVGDVRSIGLLAGVELVSDKDSKTPLDAESVKKVIGEAKKRGVIIGKNGDTVMGYNNVLALAPPLSVTQVDVDFIVRALREALATLK